MLSFALASWNRGDPAAVEFRRAKRRYKRKHRQGLLLKQMVVVMVALLVAVGYYNTQYSRMPSVVFGDRSLLQAAVEVDPCDKGSGHDDSFFGLAPLWDDTERLETGAFLLHIFFMIYTFIGIAQVADAYFEPCLAAISEALELSEDVAGATFMAAGSSAPEFFTSLMGVFVAKSDVGIGTIVGSAVFNILIIIGFCAYVAPGVEIQWYPLTRDVLFYSASIILLVLAIVDSAVSWWESGLILLLYVGYIVAMKYNKRMEAYFVADAARERVPSKQQAATAAVMNSGWFNFFMYAVIVFNVVIIIVALAAEETEWMIVLNYVFSGVFILELIVKHYGYGFYGYWRDPVNAFDGTLVFLIVLEFGLTESGFIGSVRGIRLLRTFRGLRGLRIMRLYRAYYKTYSDASVQTTYEELLFAAEIDMAEDNELGVAQKNPDENGAVGLMPGDGIAFADIEMKRVGDEDALEIGNGDGDDTELDPLKPEDGKDSEDNPAEEEDDDGPPKNPFSEIPESAFGKIYWAIVLPIMWLMYVTIPHCDREYFSTTPKKKLRWALVQFFMCLCWLLIYSLCMVFMGTLLGKAFSIPDAIMGLTVLAAGTSVPDTIASVNVAKEGKGDMAVSNAVGSNIFDICIGLGIPWLFYGIIEGEDVGIGSDSLPLMVFTLFLTVVLVVLSISLNNWKLGKRLGYIFGFAYMLYIAESLLLEFLACPP